MTSIDVETLRQWLTTGRDVILLDVREAVEYAEWAIPGSMHADVYTALKGGDPHALDALDLPTDRLIVTICGAGKVAATATAQLRDQGYQAMTLEGGMRAWSLAWNTAHFHTRDGLATVVQVRRTGKGCLSYLIGAQGQAVVIDAALDATVYEALAQQQGWQITAVLDTHIHADHLSRSRQLADRVGAPLYLPAQERVAFSFRPLTDGDIMAIGPSRLRVLHTPGHTLESSSYVLDDQVLFSGDTLFLAAVGRPDLEASPAEARERARLLYRSLQRLLTLPPETLLAPGHASRPVAFDAVPLIGTLAEVQRAIPRLHLGEDTFVTELLDHLPPTPPNHHQIVSLNEARRHPDVDAVTLEAGANRCAIA